MFLFKRLVSGLLVIVATSVFLVLFSTVLLTGSNNNLQVTGTPIVSFAEAADAISSIGDKTSKMYEKVSDTVDQTIDKAKEGGNSADGMFDRVKDLTKSVFESITNGGKRMIDSVKDTWDKHM